MNLVFCMLGFRPTFSLSAFIFIKWLFSSSLLSAIRVVSSAYLRLLTFLPAILIPGNQSVVPGPVLAVASQPAFRMIYSAYKLNKQVDNI